MGHTKFHFYVSALRNQHLANIFYRLRLIEAYGTGILKINECYNDYAVKPVIETKNLIKKYIAIRDLFLIKNFSDSNIQI